MNPYFAVVSLKIGSIIVTSTEDHLIEMTNIRISDVISQSIVFTMYDDSALILGAEIVKGKNEINLKRILSILGLFVDF